MSILTPPSVLPLDAILPAEPLLMMGAGPVPIPQKVAYANSIVINHLGPTMEAVIRQVQEMARYVFQTRSRHVLGVAGPGSAAMEMAVCNLIGQGTRVLAVCNGYFSRRMADMAQRVGGQVTLLEVPDFEAADPATVRDALDVGDYDVLTIVQGETSNTVCNRSLQQIAELASARGCLVVVDAVCTLSTMPLQMDDWNIDAVITGGQKGLSSIPGVSLLAFSDKAWERISSRQGTITHWTLDALLADNFWNKNSYHYTAPVSGILALHEALRLVCEETLEKRFRRHLVCSRALQAGIEGMGLPLLVEEANRLHSVVGVRIPGPVDPNALRLHMSAAHKVEVSGSFGLPIVRIGQMGEQCREHHVFRTLHALGASGKALGLALDLPGGIRYMEDTFSEAAG